MPIVPRPTHRHSPIKSYAWREGDCSPAGKRSRAHIASANPPAYIPRYWHNPIPRTRIDAGCDGPLGVSGRIEFIPKVELYSVSVSDCKIIFPISWSLLKAQGEKHTDFVASTTSLRDFSGPCQHGQCCTLKTLSTEQSGCRLILFTLTPPAKKGRRHQEAGSPSSNLRSVHGDKVIFWARSRSHFSKHLSQFCASSADQDDTVDCAV